MDLRLNVTVYQHTRQQKHNKIQGENTTMNTIKKTLAFALMAIIAAGMIACKQKEETTTVIVPEAAPVIEEAAPAVEEEAPAVEEEAAPAVEEEAPAAQQ